MIAPHKSGNLIQCPTNLEKVFTPPLGVTFLGDNVSQFMKTDQLLTQSLLREEADPTTMWVSTVSVGMGLSSEPRAYTTRNTTTNEYTLDFGVLQFFRPLSYREFALHALVVITPPESASPNRHRQDRGMRSAICTIRSTPQKRKRKPGFPSLLSLYSFSINSDMASFNSSIRWMCRAIVSSAFLVFSSSVWSRHPMQIPLARSSSVGSLPC